MATITMPNALNQALSEVAQQSAMAAVRSLSEKYEFDLDEALKHLNLGQVKIVKKRGPSPKTAEEKEKPKAEKKAKSKAEKKAAKGSSDDEAKPKRGKTGYLLYSDAVRDEVKAELTENLEEGEKLLGKDVVREIAIRWKALDADEQAVWKDQAKMEPLDEE